MGAAAVPIFSAVASSLVGHLLSKPSKTSTPTPAEPPPTVMPAPDMQAQQAARRRQAATLTAKQMGASDTLLTGDNSTLGA